MAAGRQDVSRRRNLYNYSRREYDHYRNDSHDVKLGRGRDHIGSHRNGYHSSSRALCSGSRQDRFSGRSEERKLDEWSKVAEVSDYEDAVRIPAEKKRKFSPIVWDRIEKEVRVSSKNRVALVAPLSLPSPPSLCVEVLDVVSDVGVLKNPISANQVDGLKGLEDKCAVTDGLVGVFDSESRADVSPLLPPEGFGGGGQGQDQVEEEEVVQVRNITMSRWASDSDSSRDLSGDDDSPDTRRSSPESGEIRIGDSVEGKARSSVSDEEHCRVVPISGDTYCENELFDVDSMDIDDKHDGNRGVNLSDSDSEVDGDSNLTEEPAVPTQRSVNMLQSCRSVFEFEKLNKINEGTYGIVYKAKDKKTGEIVALKKVKMGVGREEGFPLSSLREMNILLSFNHPSIVGVKEVVMDDDLDGVFMVMEYMEHDLKGLLEVMKQPFSTSEVKCLMLQLLQGVKSLHDNWVLHRDLKTSNILVSKEGELKICDFGLSRQYGSPLKPFTPVVVTLWYRAPELLLGTEQYSTAIDMWSVGCIMAELVAKGPLFKGKNEVDQLVKIFKTLGTPSEANWPGLSKLRGVGPNFKQPYNLLRTKFPARSFTGSPVLSDLGFDLLNELLAYDPDKRITAEDALNHEWFQEVPLPKSDFKHTFPLWHGQER